MIRMSGCGSIMVSAKVSAGVSIQDVDPECRSKVSIQDDGPRCRSEVSIRGVDPRCRSEVLAALSIERTPLRNFFVFTFWTKPYYECFHVHMHLCMHKHTRLSLPLLHYELISVIRV